MLHHCVLYKAPKTAVNCRPQVFYAQCQALLYALCYHMEPLVRGPRSSPEAAAAIRELVRQHVLPLVRHPLAPLAVLLPTVTAEFASQAAQLKLVDITSLLPVRIVIRVRIVNIT